MTATRPDPDRTPAPPPDPATPAHEEEVGIQAGVQDAPDAPADQAAEEVCATCGRPRPAGGCGCGNDTAALPEGFTPLAARGDRPRLPLTGKP